MATAAPKLMKGPKPSKNGLNAKLDYVRLQLAGHGYTRDQAIQKLLKKFPDTKPSYAKSIVYSRCAGLDFVAVRKRVLKTDSKSSPKKKATKPPVKRRPRFSRPLSSSPESSEPVVFDP